MGCFRVSLATILWISGSTAQAGVVGLLIRRHVWRTFPFFFIFGIWNLLGSAIAYATIHLHPSSYSAVYLVETVLDAILQFAVLVELGLSVLRPLREALTSKVPLAIALFILVAGAVIWPFSSFQGADQLSRQTAALTHLQQTFSILQILVFLILAGGCQLLSIGWRDRELQIATGLGFNSLVGLGVTMLHAHQSTYAQYRDWYELVVVSYLCTLLYWIVCFARQDEKRREFTPQMQSLLLAVAGSARNTRINIEDTSRESRWKRGPQ